MNNTGRTVFFGIVAGAAAGLVAALLLNRRARDADRATAITAGEGLKIGLLVFGLLRTIASLGDEEKG